LAGLEPLINGSKDKKLHAFAVQFIGSVSTLYFVAQAGYALSPLKNRNTINNTQIKMFFIFNMFFFA